MFGADQTSKGRASPAETSKKTLTTLKAILGESLVELEVSPAPEIRDQAVANVQQAFPCLLLESWAEEVSKG